MKIGEIISRRRKELGLTLEEVGDAVGVGKSTVRKWECGYISNMRRDRIHSLAGILKVSPSSFITNSETDFTYEEFVRDKNAATYRKILDNLPFYTTPVSAGTGEWLADGHEYEFADFDDVPNGATFALRVRGNSMEPIYSDGDIVFIRSKIIVESGQIGVFFLNGEGYLKMLRGNRLVSLNPEYEPITIGEYDTFFCAGRVVGKHNKQ